MGRLIIVILSIICLVVLLNQDEDTPPTERYLKYQLQKQEYKRQLKEARDKDRLHNEILRDSLRKDRNNGILKK